MKTPMTLDEFLALPNDQAGALAKARVETNRRAGEALLGEPTALMNKMRETWEEWGRKPRNKGAVI